MTKRDQPYQGTDEWIAERRGGFGASDVPTLVDGDERHWNELMLRKLNILPEIESSETMELGKEFEPTIRKLAAKRIGEEIIRVNRILRHPEHDEVRASLDGVRKRGRRPVELKKWGWRTDDFGPENSDQVPDRMLYQVEQQLAVTGHDVADLFVLFAAVEMRHYVIGRDESIIDDILNIEVAAYEYIRRGEVPPWPGPAPERPQLKADEVAADDELVELVFHHDIAKVRFDAAEAELEEVKDDLRRRLLEAGGTRGTLPDGRAFSVSHRSNRDGQNVAWEPIAAGYRRRLLELGEPEERLDFVSNALTTVKVGARPLRVTVAKPKKEEKAA
ncbi:MAG TPA: YqaJ viral recombinase family protein [Candidatus Limnocylindrales bacterium]|nr:YqaJ viral recombinase family protein [Candidatus Limnocylindrales bacterium]